MFSDSNDRLIEAIRKISPDAEIPSEDLLQYAERVLENFRERIFTDSDSDEMRNLSIATREKKGG
jgi:hypothetical protein